MMRQLTQLQTDLADQRALNNTADIPVSTNAATNAHADNSIDPFYHPQGAAAPDENLLVRNTNSRQVNFENLPQNTNMNQGDRSDGMDSVGTVRQHSVNTSSEPNHSVAHPGSHQSNNSATLNMPYAYAGNTYHSTSHPSDRYRLGLSTQGSSCHPDMIDRNNGFRERATDYL